MTAMRFTSGYRLRSTFQEWRYAAAYLAPLRRAVATLSGQVRIEMLCLLVQAALETQLPSVQVLSLEAKRQLPPLQVTERRMLSMFGHWRDRVADAQRLRGILARMLQQRLASAFNAWQDAVERDVRNRDVVTRAVARLTSRCACRQEGVVRVRSLVKGHVWSAGMRRANGDESANGHTDTQHDPWLSRRNRAHPCSWLQIQGICFCILARLGGGTCRTARSRPRGERAQGDEAYGQPATHDPSLPLPESCVRRPMNDSGRCFWEQALLRAVRCLMLGKPRVEAAAGADSTLKGAASGIQSPLERHDPQSPALAGRVSSGAPHTARGASWLAGSGAGSPITGAGNRGCAQPLDQRQRCKGLCTMERSASGAMRGQAGICAPKPDPGRRDGVREGRRGSHGVCGCQP